mgnify:CR=1 FL=1
MCGRYSWAQNKAHSFSKSLQLVPHPPSVSYNRAPGQNHPIITLIGNSSDWEFAKWGFVSGADNSKNFSKPINARIETVLEKPIFQNSVLNHRCLIPADGYFEWQRIENQKYPHFHYLTNREDFAMAGIWNKQTSIKKIEKSFAILTKQAESNISHIHNRMPVILSSKDWEEWLSPTVKIHQLLSRYSQNTQTLEFHQVSSRINGVNIDGVELLEKFSEKQSTLW